MVSFYPLRLELVEEIAAQLLIGRAPLEHMVEDHQDRMAHGNQGPFLPPSARQTSVLRRQVGLLRVARGPGRLRQGPLQPVITRTDIPAHEAKSPSLGNG